MSEIVMDASALMAFVFPDEMHNARALALVRELGEAGVSFCAPSLWESETDSVVQRRVAVQGLLAPEGEALALSVLDGLPVRIERDAARCEQVRLEARRLAQKFNRVRCYDSTYLTLALLLGAVFWTADERLFNAVSGPNVPESERLPFVRFLGNFTPGQNLGEALV